MFRSFSWLNLHSIWWIRPGLHLPVNFSAVESLSRLMVSTLCPALHFSAEQTETVCLCPWLLFCFGFWGGRWGRRKGLLLEPISDHLHSHCTPPPECWNIPVLLPSLVSQATNFKLCFYGNALKKMFDSVSGSLVFSLQRRNWLIILCLFVCLFFTKVRLADPCWAESRGNCVCYRSFPQKTRTSMCEWPRVCPSGATIHWIYTTLRLFLWYTGIDGPLWCIR